MKNTASSVTRKIKIVVLAFVTIGWLPNAIKAHGKTHPGILWTVDWSFDDQYFTVGGERTLWIYNSETLDRLVWPAPDVSKVVMSVKWHPHKNLLAVAGDRGITGVYGIPTGHKTALKTDAGARGISWNSSGDLLATAGNEGNMQIWRADGKLVSTTKTKNGKSLTGIAWHPSKDNLISIGEFITLHDSEGHVIKQITHRPKSKGPCLLLCVEWHPSGEFFVVGDYGNDDTGDPPVIQFWSSNGMLLKSIVQEDGAEFRNIHWNREGSLLASASDALRVWTKDGELKLTGNSSDLLWGVRWNHAGDKLLTSSIAGNLTLWGAQADRSKQITTNTE